MYIYPDNLTAKPILFLWSIKDVTIIGVLVLFSVLVLTQTGWLIPLVITCLYGFLSIQFDGVCILDFIRYAIGFFITKQQQFEWEE